MEGWEKKYGGGVCENFFLAYRNESIFNRLGGSFQHEFRRNSHGKAVHRLWRAEGVERAVPLARGRKEFSPSRNSLLQEAYRVVTYAPKRERP